MKNAVAARSFCLMLLASVLAISFVLGGWGCQKKGPAPGDANAPQADVPAPDQTPTAQPPAADADKVVLTVNGTAITEGQVQRRLDAEFRPQLAKLAAQSPATAAQQEQMARQNIISRLTIEQLLDEQAKAANVDVTEEQVVAEMTKQLAAQRPAVTLEKFKAIVEAQGGSFETIKEGAAKSMKYSKLFESLWGDKVAVTQEEAQKYYDEHAKEFETPEQVRASHILISTTPSDPNADPNQAKAQAREKVQKLLQQVKDGGDFAALAKEHSSCPSSARGGDLNFFDRQMMVKPFADVAFALKPGEISDVVETQFGYHIIKVTDRREAGKTAFADAQSGITDRLMKEKRSDFVRKYIQSLQENAKIVPGPGSAVEPPPAPTPAPPEPNQG